MSLWQSNTRAFAGATTLAIALAVVLAIALAGCGGGDDEEASATTAATTTPCSDAAFRLQDEELYVAQATAQNAARSGIGPDELTTQLRQGIRALRTHIEEHPPCSDDLQEIAALEDQALVGLEEAADALEAVEPGAAVPNEVVAKLEEELGSLQDAARRLQDSA
jgi:hypothetical protein